MTKPEVINSVELELPAPRLAMRHWMALGAAVASCVGPLTYPFVSGFYPDSTAQEQVIEEAVMTTLGPDSRSKINCITPGAMLVLNPFKIGDDKLGMAVPYTDTAWLLESTCDRLTSLPQSLTTTGMAQPHLSGAPEDVRTAIEELAILAHEIGHANQNTGDERWAECYSTQLASGLATNLGVDPSLEDQVRKYVIEEREEVHKDSHLVEYRFDLGTCRDGGSADLHPYTPGLFPSQP